MTDKRELMARLRDECSRRVGRKHFSRSDVEMVEACTSGADALQRELDATAAPVVVGEDSFLREALQRLCKAVDANNGSAVTITKADACAIGQFLTAALAGD